MHSVQALYQYRKSISTKPFAARGKAVKRCIHCMLAENNCICSLRKSAINCNASFALIMHDAEVLKPSNTARLIADVVPDTHAFLWHRKDTDKKLLALLADKTYQPILIFPETYADPTRQIIGKGAGFTSAKRPLFILLDGSWREARRMFRKSPYLESLPMLSFSESELNRFSSKYHIRKAANPEQLATAEVAALALRRLGDEKAGEHLALWFNLFSYQYQKSVCQPNLGDELSLTHYQNFINEQGL